MAVFIVSLTDADPFFFFFFFFFFLFVCFLTHLTSLLLSKLSSDC